MNSISPSMYRILDILNDGQCHPGTEIGKSLGLSRTAVWKIIHRLKNFGVTIHSHTKGYQLPEPLVLFNKNDVLSHLSSTEVDVDVFEHITSTNDYFQSQSAEQTGKPQICIAEHQTKGRGRLGRKWIAPFGRNLYFSLSYTFAKDVSELSGLSLVVGIAVAQALASEYSGISLGLKWPNDIYCNSSKLGGVLIEIAAEANGICRAIIGVGLNVNMKDFAGNSIEQSWTSLETLLDKAIDRNLLVARLIDSMLKTLAQFNRAGLQPFLAEWQRYDILQGKQITLHNSGRDITGIARGITPQGHLLLEQAAGNCKSYSSGDTTIVGARQSVAV